MTTSIRYDLAADGIVTLTLDAPGEAVNTMNAAFRTDLDACLTRLRAEVPGFSLIIIAHEPNPLHARRLLGEGAQGYLLVSSIYEDLASAIRLAASGKTVLSPLVACALLSDDN